MPTLLIGVLPVSMKITLSLHHRVLPFSALLLFNCLSRIIFHFKVASSSSSSTAASSSLSPLPDAPLDGLLLSLPSSVKTLLFKSAIAPGKPPHKQLKAKGKVLRKSAHPKRIVLREISF